MNETQETKIQDIEKKEEVSKPVQKSEDWRDTYRELEENEIDLLFAFYDKYNGNMNQMILDKEILFKSYSQLSVYCKRYGFKDRLIENRRKKNEDIMNSLHDAKMLAVQNAMRILEAHNVFVYKKDGEQVFDLDGKPLIVERLPFYKEIKTAWEIIKTELGEATSIGKTDVTSKGDKIQSVNVNIINGTQHQSDSDIREELLIEDQNNS